MSETDADRRDTPRAAHWSTRWIRRARPISIPACAAICLAVPPARAAGGEGVPIDARVVWVRGDSVYLAARDSIAVQPASRVTFVSRGRTIAEGEVSEVLDRALARAVLTSGAISDTKHLDRISVRAAPPPVRRLLRVGYPAASRGSGPFACPPTAPAADTATQRIEALGRVLRILRLRDSLASSPWPDTLIVQPFADAADEEIA